MPIILSKIKENDESVEYRIETDIPDDDYKNPYKPEEPLTKTVYGYGTFNKRTHAFALDYQRTDLDFDKARADLQKAVDALITISTSTRKYESIIELKN